MNIKDVFKQKQNSEMLAMKFYKNQLIFKGDINKKYDYEIKADLFEQYGNYLENKNEACD
jgi:hypothetical protein